MVKTIAVLMLAILMSAGAVAEEKASKENTAPQTDLKVDNMIIPVLMKEDVQGYYALSFTIEPKDQTKIADLLKFGPRIQDAVLHDLYVILPVIWNKDEQPGLEAMKKRIEKVANGATPKDTVGQVIINEFQITDAKKQGLDGDRKGG